MFARSADGITPNRR